MRHHCLARSKFLCCKFSKNVTSCLKQTDSIFTFYFFQYFSSICAAPLPEPIAAPSPPPPPQHSFCFIPHVSWRPYSPALPFPQLLCLFFLAIIYTPTHLTHTLTNMNGSDPPIRMYGFFPPSYSTSVILSMYTHFPWVFIIRFCSFFLKICLFYLYVSIL